ncbi:MAG: tetratricopeptide repeat protein [Chloroflexi bacterium]|nr:tetratricopeptide repeat protein [Chloroflexota bacterium]
MLTLHLALTNHQVNVRANGKESHQFSLLELSQTEQEWKDFYKNPRAYGEKLFNALFRDVALTEFSALSKQSERTIVLVLESSELDGVAWEYAYNKAKEEYVVEDCAFMRALPEKERPAKWQLKSEVDRVPLLFIPANPLVDLSGEPMRALDVEGEWREMKRHIGKSNMPFDMIELRPATPEALQSVMARFQHGMIAHFSGHGAATKDGAILLFERENGASNPLEAREFVREIKDKAWIGFLSACQSAVPERTEFSNLARELAKAGVPFALGMQFNLPDPFAPNISGQFYNYLAHGHAVPEAARQARRAVKRENEIFVGMIALYAAHPDEAGKLIWHGSGAQTVSLFRPADVSDLPSPASGLIGRQRELMRIGTRLLEEKKPLTVTLHGAGGIGKTALLWQALLRFAPSFKLTLAIGLDPLPSLESVLGRTERFLFMPSPCSNDTQEREAIVRNALTSKRTLLGLDNFETLNYALNEKGSDEEKTAKSLHTFFKSLAANGVTLCATSREVTNLGGEKIEDIQGLTNENGGRLFQENVVKQKGEIYIEKTQQVSEMVGGHPLALRLLASAFDDQVGTSLDQYIESLQSFLPKARDKWTEEDRHETLRASFDFSMNNLLKTEEGKELQIALSRLSVFIAFFDPLFVLPVVTNKWPETSDEAEEQNEKAKKLANALWERSLLERTIVLSEEEDVYLYRLQSALGVFAKEQLLDIESVKENYWKSMSNLAGIAQDGVKKSPLIAQIALYAVPDLRIAAESKSDKDAALMQFRVSELLQQLGMYNDALRLLEKSHSICETLHHQEGRAAVIGEIGKIYRTLGKLDKGYELQKESLAIAKEFGIQEGIAAALGEIGLIEETRGSLDISIQMQKENLAIAKQLGDQSRISVALYNLANIYVTHGDLDEAMKLYQQSLKIVKELGDLQGESTMLAAMAEIHVTRGRLDDAMGLYTQSLKIKESLGDIRGKAVTIGNLAKIYVIHGDLDNAMKLYTQSLDDFDRLDDLQGKATTIGEIANIYIRRGDLNKGLELQQERLSIIREIGNKKEESGVLHDMAHIFYRRGDWERAMSLFTQALEIREYLGDQKGKSSTLRGMANIYVVNGNVDGAMRLYQQVLEIADALGDQRVKGLTYGEIGAILFQDRLYPMALKSLVVAFNTLTHIGAHPDAVDVVSWLLKFQQTLGIEEFNALWKKEIGQPISGLPFGK